MKARDWFTIQLVWRKGHIVPGLSPDLWRQDDHGHLIRADAYENPWSPHGWEMDRIVPECLGGSQEPDNLRPLRCSRAPGDWDCLAAEQSELCGAETSGRFYPTPWGYRR